MFILVCVGETKHYSCTKLMDSKVRNDNQQHAQETHAPAKTKFYYLMPVVMFHILQIVPQSLKSQFWWSD
jgi:hypothetical protein